MMPEAAAPLPKFVGVAEELLDELVPEAELEPEVLAVELPEGVVPKALEEPDVPEAPLLRMARLSMEHV